MQPEFSYVLQQLMSGFGVTCTIFFLTLVMALPLGLLIAFGSMSNFKPVKLITRAFVWVIRGTPLMLQVIVVFYGPGLWFDTPVSSRLTAVVVAFVINYACYFSEIYRGGIESIARGQYEAGAVLVADILHGGILSDIRGNIDASVQFPREKIILFQGVIWRYWK